MDTNYRANIAKWLPVPGAPLEKWFTDALAFDERIDELAEGIALIIDDVARMQACDLKLRYEIIDNLEKLEVEYTSFWNVMESTNHTIYTYKIQRFSTMLKRKLNIVLKCTRNLINDIIDSKTDEHLKIIFRLVNVYNSMLDLEHNISDSSVSVFCNDCPYMLEPLKKFSVTRVLQILAKNRAEECCHELIDCLLANYKPRENNDTLSMPTTEFDVSENSSIEIYRALTRHLTPPIENSTPATEVHDTNLESIQVLVNTQNEQILRLLNTVQEISSQLLGADALKTTGVPPTVRPALQNLCDALGCHVAITAWDQLFRLAHTSAFKCQSKPSSTEGTDTGQMFVDVFQLLVTLSNECEIGGEWVIGAPLMELPLSEQIVVLHRLDHSIHMTRLWAMQEAKIIAHTWELEVFFLLVKGDIVNCIEELSYLKDLVHSQIYILFNVLSNRLQLADHSSSLSEDSVSVQVYVCAKMRAKIGSEVSVNVHLLQEAPTKCIGILAKICRVVSLANLHMCFPRSNYWRRNCDVAPVAASLYVETYFEKVLLPVLEVIEDHETSNMILRIMCEAWLDYIYLHRIKFSEYGALQLLTDFAYVSTWVAGCSIISQNVRTRLLKNEVLRRCEGVGRLLLRHPGEAIAMKKRLARKTNESGSPESPGLERMPAEMYVPNQEQWLELRAPKRYNFCCTE